MSDVDKVYIVLVNYNSWQETIECVESILKNNYNNYQIIIVDNDSINNSMSKIIDWAEGKQKIVYAEHSSLKHLSYPFKRKPIFYVLYSVDGIVKGRNYIVENNCENPIIFIQSRKNDGFAAGNNIGIKYAIKKNDFSYIWLLNNDTVIEKNSLNNIFKYAQKKKTGITGSALMYYKNPSVVQAYGGHINTFFGTGSHILDIDAIDEKLNYIVGASFLISREVIDTLGLLPEEYFLYYEETDYCFNAQRHGFKLGVALDSIVYHKEGASTGGSSIGKTKSEFSDILSLQNRVTFHRKYLGGGIGLYTGLLISLIVRIKRLQLKRVWKIIQILWKNKYVSNKH